MADATDDSFSEEFLNTPLGGTPEPSSDEPATPAQEPEAKEQGDEAESTPATDDTKEGTPASETPTDKSEGEQETEPQSSNDRRKEQARQGWEQRQRLKDAEQRFDKSYSPKTQEDYQEEGIDPRDARIEALEAQRQFDQQRSAIVQLNADMSSDAIEVESDFDIFNPKSPNYDKEFAEEVMADYRLDAHLEVDENDPSLVLRADRPLYDYFQRRYNSYQRGLSKGTSEVQQNRQEMLARTENPGGSSSNTPKNLDKLTTQELREMIGDEPLFN